MKQKQYKVLSVLLGLTIILFFFSIFFSNNSGINQSSAPVSVASVNTGSSVALISIDGAISAGDSRYVLDNLRRVSKISGLQGLILKINSPGGTTGTSQEIYNELMKIRKLGIKIVSVIGDLGASGGYYAASASDIIVANGSSLTGSIGVIMSTMNFKGIADKYGIKSVTFTSGKMKDMLSPFRDIRPDEAEYIHKMIVTIYNQFVEDVLAGRNGSQQKITREKLLSVADGRVLTGIDAQKEGLIDVIGGYSTAEEEMKKLLNVNSIAIRTFSRTYWDQLATLLIGGSRNMVSHMNPMGDVAHQFLKEHLDTPLYYSPIGGN